MIITVGIAVAASGLLQLALIHNSYLRLDTLKKV